MPQLFDPKDATERLIEWVAQQREIGWEREVAPANLTKMAMLNYDALESGNYRTGYFPSLDLDSTLVSAVADVVKEDSILPLVRVLKEQDATAAIYSQPMEKILDEEFEQSGIVDEHWERSNVFQKANIIAVHRTAPNIIHLPKPADYNSKPHKYEFKVHLMMLRGGYGSIYTGTILFFSYGILFHSFLRTLQSETQLCIIPPHRTNWEAGPLAPETLDTPPTPPTYTQSITVEADAANENPKETAEHDLQQISAPMPVPSSGSPQNITEHELQQMSAAVSVSSTSTSLSDDYHVKSQAINGVSAHTDYAAHNPDQSQEPRMGSGKGFTLEDGPWSYFISNSSNPPAKRIWIEIVNMKDYTEMVETTRRRAEIEVHHEISVVVMHSLEVEAYEEYKATCSQERIERQKPLRPGGSDSGFEGDDDDDEGEPYLQWLSRTLGAGEE